MKKFLVLLILLLSMVLAVFGFNNAFHCADILQHTSSLEIFKANESQESTAENTKDEMTITEKYESFKSINSDLVGYIRVPSTTIDYPIVQGKNDFYLNRDIYSKSSASGAIFLEESQNGFQDINLVHGHNLGDGTMFHDLEKFLGKDFFYSSTLVLFDGVLEHVYKPFSICKVSEGYKINVNLYTNSDKYDLVQKFKDGSIYPVDYSYIYKDNILLLNTCDNSGKHIMIALYEMEEN